LTAAQKDSLLYRPYLEAMHRGERIDTFMKESVREDKSLNFLKITPRFEFGPDYHDPINGVWYDATTPGQWRAHENKYDVGFGRGISLFYCDEKLALKFGISSFMGSRSAISASQESTGALICATCASRNRTTS
jgi:hypothetical protein